MAEVVGEVIMWAGELSTTNVNNLKNNGWLVCDGQLLDVATHKQFYDIIRDNYKYPGEVLPVGKFRIPDFRGRTTLGAGQGPNLTNRLLGSQVGEETHTLSIQEMPSHNHDSGGFHCLLQADGHYTAQDFDDTNGEPNIHTQASIQPSGGSQPHNNMQPSLSINFLIKFQ